MWLQHQCPRGGIGRRAWFRSMCLRVWGFESLRGHHYQRRVVIVVVRRNAVRSKNSSNNALVAELVDAHGSGPCAFGCGGSSPSVGTTTSNELLIVVVRSNSNTQQK